MYIFKLLSIGNNITDLQTIKTLKNLSLKKNHFFCQVLRIRATNV